MPETPSKRPNPAHPAEREWPSGMTYERATKGCAFKPQGAYFLGAPLRPSQMITSGAQTNHKGSISGRIKTIQNTSRPNQQA